MGKRKQVIPKKVGETDRQNLTWNMSDMQVSGSAVNVIADDDPALLAELENASDVPVKVRKTDGTEAAEESHVEVLAENNTSPRIFLDGLNSELSYRREDLLDIFDLHVHNSSCNFQIYQTLKTKKDGWGCELARFEIRFSAAPVFIPLPVNGLANVDNLNLYVNSVGEKHIVAYDKTAGQNGSSKSKRRSSANGNDRNIQFWLVDVDIPLPCLEALKCRKLQVVMDRFDSEEMSLCVKIMGTEEVLTQLSNPSDAVRTKMLNTSLKTLMEHFYRISDTDYSHLPYTKKHDLDELFRVIKGRHGETSLSMLNNVQHPDLLPWLRPYQQQAISWMVQQEKQHKLTEIDGLHMLYTKITTLDGQDLFYNKYAGSLVREHPPARVAPPGGILGDEMGLGKTVEVLACMLHHPRDQISLPDPLPLVEDDEWEHVRESKKRKKRKQKIIVPSSDSDDTVDYSIQWPDESFTKASDKSVSADDSKQHESKNFNKIDQSGNTPMSCDLVADKSDNSRLSCESANQSSDRKLSCDLVDTVPCVVDQSGDRNSTCNIVKSPLEEIKIDNASSEDSPIDVNSGSQGTQNDKVEENDSGYESKACDNTVKIEDGSCAAIDSVEVPVFKNIFTEQPEVHQSAFECLCGKSKLVTKVGRKKRRLHPVQCTVCRLWQHAECVNYDVKDPYRGEFKCPHCHAAAEPIPSGATLIISPASIAHQWVEEILKHVAREAINVLMYDGVSKQRFIQPRTLAKQDIVITSYETLRKETDYVDLPHSNTHDGRKLRHPKRFMAIPSPLTAVQWWRICLDEAQMVECTTTKTAEMALRLSAVNRWCVTGTPIQKGIDDLYGLLLFLGVDPYWVQMWWNRLVFEPYCHGVKAPMHDLLTSVLWRTVKTDVLDQIDIPGQSEQIHWLNFSPVEEHFYRRQYKECAKLSMQTLRKWSDSTVKLCSLDRGTVAQMLNPLVRLRQACCHPQVVRGEFLPLKKDTMTMDQLLESLTKKAKLEAEESHRALVAAMNGQAGLHIIKEQFLEAVDLYREVLRSVEEHKDILKTDGLQQLHAMFNLNEILVSKPAGVAPTLRDDLLSKQIDELREHYLAKAVAYLKSTEEAVKPAQVEVKLMQKEVVDGELWYLDVIQWAVDRDMTENLLWKIEEDVRKDKSHFDRNNRERPRTFLERHLNSTRALQFALHKLHSDMKEANKALHKAMNGLDDNPSQELINKTVECCLRPVAEVLNNCPFCKAKEHFEIYEAKLFSFVEKDVLRLGPEGNTGYKVNREGTWADSDLEKALRSLLAFAKSFRISEELINCGNLHLKFFEALKKEYKKMRAYWAGKKEHVASFDELDMSTTRLRLRLPDEPVPETPQPNVLDKMELAQHELKLSSDRIVANGELRRKLGQLLYLNNLAKNQINTEDGSNPDPCPICQQELGKNWSVMQCGHCFCMDCIRILQERSSFGRQHFTIKCAICRQSSHQSEISYVVTTQKLSDDEVKVKGSHSTKVEAVVKCLLNIRKEDPKAKSLVFSTWTDVLSVIARALTENDLKFKALYASGKFQENLSSFKQQEEETILLLPVHSGANGLNLIEATHVLLVEPILNPAQELQAIGRVHRIGQTRPTCVHRFIVQNTIEQKMYTLLKSMDVNPNVAKGSDELSLTIGDITSLFVQQMEPVDREGVHSPEAELVDDPIPPIEGLQLDNPTQSEDDLMDNIDNSSSSDQPSCSYMGQSTSGINTASAGSSGEQSTNNCNENTDEDTTNIDQ